MLTYDRTNSTAPGVYKFDIVFDLLKQCFPNFFICWHSKIATQILRHYSHMNLFMLIARSITGDSEKGDDVFCFLEIITFSGNITQSLMLSVD